MNRVRLSLSTRRLAIVLALTASVACQARDTGRPPYAVAQSLREPTLFADGVISTGDDEFGGSFAPDGRTVYFSRSAPHSYLYALFESHWSARGWSQPVILPFSGHWTDSDPVLSPDGRQMYWSSDRPVDGKIKHDYDIWMSTRNAGGGWGEPVHLPAPINSDASEFCASVAQSGTLYFSSERDGGPGGAIRVYRSHPENNGWSTPENLTEAMGAKHDDVVYDLDVLVDPAEKTLFVGSSGRPDGLGNFDIYLSRSSDGKWGPLVHLPPPINTPTRDYSPHPSPDGKYLFFASERGLTAGSVTARWTSYRDLVTRLRSTLNGSGNIYQIPMRVVDSLAGP
jgi:Tol biopolymer transport system component